jgi:hypothetical protein
MHDRTSTPDDHDPLVDVEASDPSLAQTAVNDAVAGETVLPQPGDGPDGPTGGNERERRPLADDNDLARDDIDLDDDLSADAAVELEDDGR